MSHLRFSLTTSAQVLLIFGTVVVAPAVLANESGTPKWHGGQSGLRTLNLTAASNETERGIADAPPAGLSQADIYTSNAKLRNRAGKIVGTYHVACTITDARDEHGSAWSTCSIAANFGHRGMLLASALTELLNVDTSPGGFGVAPPVAEFAIVGGTGDFAGASGTVTSTRDVSLRRLRFRYTLAPPR